MFRSVYYSICNIINKVEFRRKGFNYPDTLKLYGHIHLCGSGKCQIAENVQIISDWRANPIGGEKSVFDFRGGCFPSEKTQGFLMFIFQPCRKYKLVKM